ncbi:MAG TPA: hypothetical protein PLR65_07530 [Anaerolineales bacterium]|nr:hypothetical protein [Anaerolineales bacterium]
MSGKFALIIGNTEYADPSLAQLTAPVRIIGTGMFTENRVSLE